MDIINKNAELMVSQVGHLAFDIDRSLLLMLLGNFYGLESSLEEAKAHNGLPTKTETRLKNRLALDICTLIFNLQNLRYCAEIKTGQQHGNYPLGVSINLYPCGR